MSNLYKSTSVVCKSNEAKLIDNNAFVFEKIAKLREYMACSLEQDEDAAFIEGIEADSIEVLLPQEVNIHKEQILEQANLQAKQIIETAMAEAEKIKAEAFQTAKEDAYQAAIKEAEVDIQNIKGELGRRKAQQEQEYSLRLREMEPLLVDVILEVFSRVTHVLSEDKRDLILHLVNSVMTKTELSKNFTIRVSKDDYAFLVNSREKIYGAVSKEVYIEILEDLSLSRNQCIIETDGGIYDCSLDIQLENLIKDMKLLSCMLD